MTDITKLHLAVDLGARARDLLSNELLREAFNAVEQDFIDTWRRSPMVDREQREQLYIAQQIPALVLSKLEAILRGGKVAQDTLDYLADEEKRQAELKERYPAPA